MAHYIGKAANEFFIGNVREGKPLSEHLSPLKTLRKGTAALDVDGKPLPHFVPLFCNESESDHYERIMMARMSRR